MIDINSTRLLLAALEQSYPPTTLLRDTFFPNTPTFPTEEVDMDYKKGTRRLAPFVVKGGSKGANVSRTGFDTKSYKPPMMMPKRPTTISDISSRGFGENVYSTRTPEQRALELRAQDMADMQDMITRRIEWMCAQLMVNGSFTAKGYADDGKTVIEDTVTYAWTQKLTLTGVDTWDNSGADIYGQMETAHQTVSRNSGRSPEVAICSYKTKNYLLNNSKIMEYLKIPLASNLSLMSIAPRITAPGVVRIGIIESLNLELYAYDGIYQDDDGSIKQYIPDDYFIMGVKGRGSQLFGAITQLENGKYLTYEGKNVPKVWDDEENDVQMIRLASRCVPKPEFIDDWFTLKVK